MRKPFSRSRTFLPLIAVLLSIDAYSDCVKDFRSNKSGGVAVTDVTILGTQTVTSKLLGDMTSTLVGACFNDSSEELGERVKALFLDRGYFAVEVKNVKIKPGDPLAVPKPIVLEAEVSEGKRYRLGDIKITGNHAFSAEQILSRFSLHKGDLFARDKIGAGFESLRGLYAPAGYLDMFFVPDTIPVSNASIMLTVVITEGPQYQMGELQVFAEKEIAAKLRANWQLAEGAVFDSSYVSKYFSDNRSLLGSLTPKSIQVVTDCPRAVATVRILVNAFDPGAQIPAENVPCDSRK